MVLLTILPSLTPSSLGAKDSLVTRAAMLPLFNAGT